MKAITTTFVALIFLQMNSQCTEEQKNLENLQKEYNVLFVDIEKQADLLKTNIPDTTQSADRPSRNLAFDVVMKDHNMSFDVAKITMKNRDFSFNVPEISMKTKSFSVPTSTWRWKVKRLCCGIKTRQLVIVNGMKRVEFKSPQIKMNRKEIITKIPEFTFERKNFLFKIPEFTLVNPIPEEPTPPSLENQKKAEEIAAQADTLSLSASILAKEQKDKSLVIIKKLFECASTELSMQKSKVTAEFDQNILQIDKIISDLVQQGLDPSQVTADDGTVSNLSETRSNLISKNNEIVESINSALRDLENELNTLTIDLEDVVSSD